MWYKECCRPPLTTGDGAMESVLIRDVLDNLPVPELEQSLTTFLAPMTALVPDRRLQRVCDWLYAASWPVSPRSPLSCPKAPPPPRPPPGRRQSASPACSTPRASRRTGSP